MRARDVMTTDVVAVPPDDSVRHVARILIQNDISAVPVVSADEIPLGIISEGDLISRSESDRESDLTRAHQIMAAPVVTVSEDADLAEVAKVLTAYHIKRVPVLRDGKIVGIVSRADLVRAFGGGDDDDAAAGGAHRPASTGVLSPASGGLTVSDFQGLVADHEVAESHRKAEDRLAAVAQRKATVKLLIDHHIGDKAWLEMLQRARVAAEGGAEEYPLLRFPAELCSDGGRAINAIEPAWPETLRGEAAEAYLRWERDLKGRGFRLAARVLNFPGGFLGDVGLFLIWGNGQLAE